MSIGIDIANKALKLALPSINRKITQAIQKLGLDPYQHVMHYEETLGEVAGASITAAVGLSNLRGLSSLSIERIEFTSGDFHPFDKKDSTAAGTFSIHFSQDLTLDVGGKLSGKISVKTPFGTASTSHSEPIDADLSNSGSSLSGEGDFVLGSLTNLEIKSFHLNTLDLKMGASQVEIHGTLGNFDALLNDLIQMITDKFNSELSGHITSALKLAIQEAVDAALPISLK